MRALSEYELLERAITPILEEEDISSNDFIKLSLEELALLSARSGVEPRKLLLYKQSQTLSLESKLPSELFYALGRQKVGLTLPAILSNDATSRQLAIEKAFDTNQIPPRLKDSFVAAVETLDDLSIEHV